MGNIRNPLNIYVNAIINDIQKAFVREETKIYEDDQIVREYEFDDGAVIKYEWQSEKSATPTEPFNHRFTILILPSPNPDDLELGLAKQMNYS